MHCWRPLLHKAIINGIWTYSIGKIYNHQINKVWIVLLWLHKNAHHSLWLIAFKSSLRKVTRINRNVVSILSIYLTQRKNYVSTIYWHVQVKWHLNCLSTIVDIIQKHPSSVLFSKVSSIFNHICSLASICTILFFIWKKRRFPAILKRFDCPN